MLCVISSAFFTFYSIVMKRSILSFVETLVAHHIYFQIFKLFRQMLFGFSNQFVNSLNLTLTQFLTSHPTSRAVDVLKHFRALNMNEMSTPQRIVMFGWVEQLFEANRTLRICYIIKAFMIFVRVRNTISTLKTMSYTLDISSSTHLAIILNQQIITQWKMSVILSGLFSYKRHLMQVYYPNLTEHFLHCSQGSWISLQLRHLICWTF